jgi:hypothetical protein
VPIVGDAERRLDFPLLTMCSIREQKNAKARELENWEKAKSKLKDMCEAPPQERNLDEMSEVTVPCPAVPWVGASIWAAMLGTSDALIPMRTAPHLAMAECIHCLCVTWVSHGLGDPVHRRSREGRFSRRVDSPTIPSAADRAFQECRHLLERAVLHRRKRDGLFREKADTTA